MQSLSEIDTTSKRASKAAGFSWGISEEIGKAVRNLELYGLPGITNLNLYLKKIKNKHPKKINKLEKENKDKELCPIYCGVAFLDQSKYLQTLKKIKFYNVNYPLLILPFISKSSEILGEKLLVKSEDEYTSPIKNLYNVDECFIICTENSIYITSSEIPKKRIS